LSGFKAGGGAFGCIPENVLPERAKICGGDFGNISRYAQTMPTIDDERYPSKKWLRDIDKDFDMIACDDDGDE
jgi:hypothetical protein